MPFPMFLFGSLLLFTHTVLNPSRAGTIQAADLIRIIKITIKIAQMSIAVIYNNIRRNVILNKNVTDEHCTVPYSLFT